MKIGLISPFMPHDLADLMDDCSRQLLTGIRGVTATPVTPIAREWLRKGHTLSVFCLDPSIASPQHLTGERLSIHVLPKRRNKQCLLDIYREERKLIREAVEREAPEVLSAQWTYDHALGALECGIPTIVTCHDTPLRYAWISKSLYMTYHLLVAAKVIRSADHLVCVSPYTAKHIQTIFRPKCEVDVIPNGILDDFLERGSRRFSTRRKPSDCFTICSAGGWGDLKNIKPLLRAFSIIRETHKNARLTLFGRDLGKNQAAESWARQQQLNANVEFKGNTTREHLLDFLENEADLMVHPSKVETHGMVLIEAMACGVPVVGGIHSGAVPWTLEHGKAGILCNIRDPEDIAKSIRQVINNGEEIGEMVRHAWHSVSQSFNIEQTAEANEELLYRFANGNGPPEST